jgi:hypothetical protein
LLAARYRVEVRDRDGKLVTVLEGDSKSFTVNFIKLLIAAHYNGNDAPTFSVYNVAGNVFYTGSVKAPYVGDPRQIFSMDYNYWGEFPSSDYYAVPAIWLGTSPCANPALANGPCGDLVACCIPSDTAAPYPFSPYNFSPDALCYGITSCSPSLTEEGWALTITNQWLNTSQSPVTVGSMALVSGVYATIPGATWEQTQHPFEPYAIIVDNLPSPVTVWPGFLITASYTIYFPV